MICCLLCILFPLNPLTMRFLSFVLHNSSFVLQNPSFLYFFIKPRIFWYTTVSICCPQTLCWRRVCAFYFFGCLEGLLGVFPLLYKPPYLGLVSLRPLLLPITKTHLQTLPLPCFLLLYLRLIVLLRKHPLPERFQKFPKTKPFPIHFLAENISEFPNSIPIFRIYANKIWKRK